MAIDTSLAPYYDDFNEDKGFHRLLFRPSRAVQARELTQLQTILQNQITRFGQNIFKDGTVVIPGGISVDSNYEFVKVQDVDISSIQAGATVVGGTSGITAILIQAVAVAGSDPATLYIRYTDGGSGTGGRFQNGETLTFTNPNGGSSGAFTVAAAAATGTGTKANLDKGVYFVNGFFVVATSQSLILEKYGVASDEFEVGLVVGESIVTSGSDSSLLSNAAGTNNVNAPGADRLKYALTLTKKSDIEDTNGDVDVDYFTIAIIKGTRVVQSLTRTQYSLIGDELARRTFDESGNYTVDPFIIHSELTPGDDTKLTFVADPGKAYVRGYEIEKYTSTNIIHDRALDTETQNNASIPVTFGNYVRTSAPTGLPDISTFESVNLRDSTNATIGTARVRAVEYKSASIYHFYLFDVSMNAGKGFNEVRDLQATGFEANIIDDAGNVLTSDNAKLKDTANNTLLFPMLRSRIQTIQDITVRAQRRITFTSDGSGNETLDTLDSNVTWANTAGWILVNDSGAIVTVSATTAGLQTITLSGLAASTAHTLIAYVDKTTTTTSARSKTLTTVTDSVITPGTGGVGTNEVSLGQHDIYVIDAVKDVSDGDADITNRYTLDNGQRTNSYQIGKLKLKSGASAPSGNVKVTFKYFQHGAGDYFNVDSYNSFISDPSYSYTNIPTFVRPDGVSVFLAEVFDFRPVIDDDNTDYSTAGALVNEIPLNGEAIQADVTFYLPRTDILYLSSEGNFGFAKGISSKTPVPPPIPNDVMPLYVVRFGPGTLDQLDVGMSFIENKRYTMRDIGRLESRISRVEEWSTLSLLENETSNLNVIDANGNSRFQAGFFVDSFDDHRFSDIDNPNNRSSINPRLGEVRPEFVEKNTRIIYKSTSGDNDISNNVIKKGDQLFMQYTEVAETEQLQASSVVNVNPYAITTGIGFITLSPDSDEWRDVETTTTAVTQVGSLNPGTGTPVVSPNLDDNWDNWNWNWTGDDNITDNTPPVVDPWGSGGGGALNEFERVRF